MSVTEAAVELAASLLARAGLPGLFLLAVAELLVAPIPGGAVFALAGFLSSRGAMGLAEAVLVGTLGNLAGALIVYWLGLRAARPALLKLGKYLMIGERDLEAAEEFFRRRGALAVFLGSFVPGVRSLMGFPAGMARMNPAVFAAAIFSGSLPWNAAFALAGYALGERWSEVLRYSSYLDLAGAAALALAAVYLAAKLIKRRRG
jgi:membrane protein DedA with SNARE-associated domain